MNARPRILVVDDDKIVSRSFERVLTSKGYDVVSATSGEEALKDFENGNFDAVFTDIKMQGMDGLEVTRQIKERVPSMPVMVITGFGTEETEARAKALGAFGLTHKPLTPEVIENITIEALTKAHADPVEPEVSAFKAVKNIGLFFASPFIGLAYALAFPVISLYMIAKIGVEAYKKG